jgi:hypothetical protein
MLAPEVPRQLLGQVRMQIWIIVGNGLLYLYLTSNSSPSPDMMTRAPHCDRSASLTNSLAWFCRSENRQGRRVHLHVFRCVAVKPLFRCVRGRTTTVCYCSVKIPLFCHCETFNFPIIPPGEGFFPSTDLRSVLCYLSVWLRLCSGEGKLLVDLH